MIISEIPSPWHLLMISARSEGALASVTDTIVRFLGDSPRVGLADVSFTLLAGRELLDLRKALVCRNAEDAVAVLRGQHPRRLITGASQARNRKTVFFLSDRSVPALNRATALYASLPVFRQGVDRCLDLAGGQGADKLARTFLSDEKVPDAPAAFVFLYALAQQWLAWGLSPDALIAEGAGECVAAHLAGCISLEAALTLARGGPSAAQTAAPPRLPYHSGVTGTWISPRDIADGGYWSTLATDAGVAAPYRVAEDDRVALDIGSGDVRAASQLGVTEDVSPDLSADAQQWMLSSLGRLAVSGARIDWMAHFAGKAVKRLSLPTYSFEPLTHWFTVDKATSAAAPIPAPSSSSAPSLPAQETADAAAEGMVERFLVETCQDLLGIEPIGLHDNVMKLGMDSLNVMQLSLAVNRRFGTSIAPHHMFSEPDIASLARKILAIRPDLKASGAPPSRPAAPSGGTSVAQLARLVENLSDAEVKRMLSELGVSREYCNG